MPGLQYGSSRHTLIAYIQIDKHGVILVVSYIGLSMVSRAEGWVSVASGFEAEPTPS